MGLLEKSLKDLGILYTIFKLVLPQATNKQMQGHNKGVMKMLTQKHTKKGYLVSIFK
jgi:pyruvate/2-oxoglutarate dehydrogenase complex dihydrolipoamide dehydrogenase (E3) component